MKRGVPRICPNCVNVMSRRPVDGVRKLEGGCSLTATDPGADDSD
jgi:hypothetical protein